MSEILRVNGLVKRYKELIALDNVNLSVKEGEIFGLLGPNGSGKSTTINCILSLLEFDKGEITVFGKEMTPKSYDLKKDIGVVPQEVAVYETLNVYENIDFFCGLYIKDKAKRKQYVPSSTVTESDLGNPYPVEVKIGGATIFVTDINRFEQV